MPPNGYFQFNWTIPYFFFHENYLVTALEPNYDDNNGDPIALAGKFEGDIAGVIPHDMKEVLRSLVAKSKSKNKNPVMIN